MIIDNAAIKMHGQNHQHQYSKRSEALTLNNERPARRISGKSSGDSVELSKAAETAATEKTKLDMEKLPASEDMLLVQIIRRMFKEITGQDLELFLPGDLQGQADEVSYQAPQQPPAQAPVAASNLVYQQSTSYFEAEVSSFSAEGSITTKDGKSFDFSVSLSMSRAFYSEQNLSLAVGNPKKTDPLVINFEGTAAELSTTTFQFDIDANGSQDQIAVLKSNSGMLALDKNGDGKINDGSELFGAKTGNGFNELAAFDDDSNGFIDAADSVYNKLRIWQRHADGSQQLLALGDKNIGAIYLGHQTTPFQLKSADNQSLGEVASSGVYLTEQGQVGTVQQINFTV